MCGGPSGPVSQRPALLHGACQLEPQRVEPDSRGEGGRAATSPSASPDGGEVVLRIGTTQDVDNLNPFTGYSTCAYEVFHLNYDLLVGYRASDGAPQAELADSWTSTPDGLEWTFKIHPGIKWQDGVPLTAKDVAFTHNYIIQNQLAAYTSHTNNIKKAVAVDDATVNFILTKPKANMLRLWIPIVLEHMWGKVPGKSAGNDYQNSPPSSGAGPFRSSRPRRASTSASSRTRATGRARRTSTRS